jgi:hypothetical protein
MSSNSTRESGRRLEEVATAVAKARVLAGMTKGRYPITYDPVWFMTRLDHLQRMYTVARLLQLDVMLHAQQGEVDGALDSCRAQLNVGRSLGDEPMAAWSLSNDIDAPTAAGLTFPNSSCRPCCERSRPTHTPPSPSR